MGMNINKVTLLINPADYAFTDYPVEMLCEWMFKRGILDSHNQVQKKGNLVIEWVETLSEHDLELIREGRAMSDRDTRRGV